MDTERLDEELDRVARAHGLPALLAHVYARFGLSLPNQRAVSADDAGRHRRMAELARSDPELLERQRRGDWSLAEIARRVIREAPQANEIDPATGEPYPNQVKRLVKGFPYFCFGDAKRGWDQWREGMGLWFS